MAASATARDSSLPPGGSAGGTVLVVDDEETFRTLLVQVLTGAGYEVLQASGASAAIAVVERHTGGIALLVSDLSMPDGGGVTLAQELVRRLPDLRVLLMSGSDPDDVERRESLPAATFLSKPFPLATLLATVKRLLEQPPES